MCTSFFLNIENFTCFGVNSVKYNTKMHEIEIAAGEGVTTVGKLIQENKVENNPEYKVASQKFYRFHGLSSVANLVSLVCTVGQFYLLAKKASFSF